MNCPSCGANVSDGAKFCPKCGTRINAAGTPGGPAGHKQQPKPVSPKQQPKPTPQGKPPKQKKSKNGLIAVLVTVLVLALCACGGYVGYRLYQKLAGQTTLSRNEDREDKDWGEDEKPREKKTTEEETAEEETTAEETTAVYETDEFGNLIDPPEDLLPPESTWEGEDPSYESGPGYPTEEYGPGSSAVYPGNSSGYRETTGAYPGTQENPTQTSKPQESQSQPGSTQPGSTPEGSTQESKPQESTSQGNNPPGGATGPVRPGGDVSSPATEATKVSPGSDGPTAAPTTGQVVLPPGQETGPGYQPGPGGN